MNGNAVSLGTDYIRDLVSVLSSQGFTIYFYGRKPNVHTIAATRREADVVEVVILRGPYRAVAYRVPAADPGVDVLAPEWLLWHRRGSASSTIRAVGFLPASSHPDSPAHPYRVTECPEPEEFGVPLGERQDCDIRFPPMRPAAR
ncbi:hypothetical protein F0L68_00515 [Solihabitans fulvus]|uniref:Uncharacterized protein n=1 Tax=Solihabitans fulvus TaxID=1892852 RepID=A0A5B2XWH3_9PSEU|nr:hypothetical protein [Solihabitans fulvus]KAA2267051.1 hypothetical protein F0L68_00515 [Solihabitans fulvus]